MNEFIEQFLLESREYVEQATADLLALEKTPGDRERLDSAFRAFHTLKGGAGIVDFYSMAEAVHAAEEELSAARSGARIISARLVGDCLACLDQVAEWLDILERTGGLPAQAAPEAATIVARFARPAAGGRPLAPMKPAAASEVDSDADALTLTDEAIDEGDVTIAGGAAPNDGPPLPAAAKEVLDAQIALIESTGSQGAAGRLGSAGAVAAAVLRHVGRAADAGDMARTTEISVEANDPRLLRDAIAAISNPIAATHEAHPAMARDQEIAGRTLRIDASRIDTLVNLTGELTVAKNAIGHASKLAQYADPVLASILARRYAVLDRLVGDLQRSVLALRVLPLRHVFQRFPRLLREISGDLGKPASLIVEGGDTEADKVIVEMLFEPLLHVLRNAIDHGIESPAARAEQHKPLIASIRLRATRHAENVIVEVSDDGRGIDVAKVREVASQRGMMTAELLAALSDEEAINLIFEPGFSTAGAVTGLSGRGVGMDAVRHAVHRVGGTVSVESRAGAGTTVRFTLPFSVMITRVMVVAASGQSFGIPLDMVVETLRIGVDRISAVGAAHAFVLRNRTVPLLALAETLGLPETRPLPETPALPRGEQDQTDATIVVTRVDGHYGALCVDRIGERLEVMLKPLDGLLAGMRGVAGSTLLGDGSVLLILDVAELFQ